MDGCAKDYVKTCPTDATPDEDKTDDEPSSSRSLACPRGEAVLSQTVQIFRCKLNNLCEKVSKSPTKSSKQESTCSFPERGRDEQRITTKAFL